MADDASGNSTMGQGVAKAGFNTTASVTFDTDDIAKHLYRGFHFPIHVEGDGSENDPKVHYLRVFNTATSTHDRVVISEGDIDPNELRKTFVQMPQTFANIVEYEGLYDARNAIEQNIKVAMYEITTDRSDGLSSTFDGRANRFSDPSSTDPNFENNTYDV